MANLRRSLMGHEELTLEQMVKAQGRLWEMCRGIIHALQAAGGTANHARQLCSSNFHIKLAYVLLGKYKIVPKSPEELIDCQELPEADRANALLEISGNPLKVYAVNQTLPPSIRRAAFARIEDEEFVGQHALSLQGNDTTDRITTMRNVEILHNLAHTASEPLIAKLAACRLVDIDPAKALLLAIDNRQLSNGECLGVEVVKEAQRKKDLKLLESIYKDNRAASSVWVSSRDAIQILTD
jgi:hypothetical protein